MHGQALYSRIDTLLLTSHVLVRQGQAALLACSTVSILQQGNCFNACLVNVVAFLDDVSVEVDRGVVVVLVQSVVGKEDTDDLLVDPLFGNDAGRGVSPSGRSEGHDYVGAGKFASGRIPDRSPVTDEVPREVKLLYVQFGISKVSNDRVAAGSPS